MIVSVSIFLLGYLGKDLGERKREKREKEKKSKSGKRKKKIQKNLKKF